MIDRFRQSVLPAFKKAVVDLRTWPHKQHKTPVHFFQHRCISLMPQDLAPGGGKLHIQMREVDGSADSNVKVKSVCVGFTDTGHGIAEDELNKIFDFYFSTKHDGTGLGLAIVQQIVDEHGGRITVTSEVGCGTTFTVYLPLNG